MKAYACALIFLSLSSFGAYGAQRGKTTYKPLKKYHMTLVKLNDANPGFIDSEYSFLDEGMSEMVFICHRSLRSDKLFIENRQGYDVEPGHIEVQLESKNCNMKAIEIANRIYATGSVDLELERTAGGDYIMRVSNQVSSR